MATFTDCLGREHTLVVRYPHLSKLREIGMPITGPGAGDEIGSMIFSDFEKLVKVVHLISDGKLTFEEITEGIDGEALERAGMAVADAFADFTPNSKVAEFRKRRLRTALKHVEAEMQKRWESSDFAASLPDSAESIPTAGV